MIHLADTKEKRDTIRHLIEIRKKQIKAFEEGLIKPLKDNIKIAEGCIHRRESLERLHNHSKAVRKQIYGMIKSDGYESV
jgi:hypothetical protein